MGLALNIWNEVSFAPPVTAPPHKTGGVEPAEKLSYHVTGEGAEKLNKGSRNLLTKAFALVYNVCGKPLHGMKISAHNGILMSSGLGSSAAAIVAGLYGANETLGRPLHQNELLNLANQMEGHPDNVAPALLGGLVVSVMSGAEIISRRYEIPEWTIVVVKPDVEWLTKTARAVLPKSISRADAIYNLGRGVLVVDALRNSDLDLLQKVMDDRIHQPYRLKHITGGMSAYKAAKRFGAAALSGAGPAIIAFVKPENAERARREIMSKFEERGIDSRGLVTMPSMGGVGVVSSQ
jgi:homoserine kinase